MHKTTFVSLAAIIAIGFIGGCSSSQKSDSSIQQKTEEATSWSGQMQRLNMTVSELVPYVFDDRKFYDPKNYAEIEEHTKTLASLAHGLDQSQKKFGFGSQ